MWKPGDPSTWAKMRPSASLHRKGVHNFTLQELRRLVGWLVDNTFVLNNSLCRRQKIGLPMGTNCAPALCNLCLFAWEYQFIDRLVDDGKLEEARAHHMTFRLIDDVLSLGNPFHDNFFKTCYPSFLTLNDTTLEDGSVNFLGMHVSDIHTSSLSVSVYDKRKDFLSR